MKLSIHWLPQVQAILETQGQPQFAIVRYDEFVRVAAAAPGDVPDVSAVLDANGAHALVAIEWPAYRSFLWQFEIRGTVDERDYLTRHPDVRAAVERGELSSATEHYTRQGYFERRPARLV